MKFILAILLLVFCQSCYKTEHKLNIEFVEKYGKDDFSIFKNKSLFVRGFDNNNGTIIFISDRKQEKKCSAPYVIIIDNKTKKIKSTSRNLLESTCVIDSVLFQKLSLLFYEYNINYLSVDSNSNVSIKPLFFEGKSNLIKFSNTQNLTTKEYKNIKNQWYEKTE